MYAKDIRPLTRKSAVTPPQNYSGTAFSERRIPSKESSAPMPVPADTPALPPPSPQEDEPNTAVAARDEHSDSQQKPTRGILSSLIPPGFSGGDSDFGFEELLLVGLIFLLSRGENDSDILLMLALLLLYH